MTQIVVCMGSSCFSRGNSINAEMIQNFLAKHNLVDEVELSGCLCAGECQKGPNLHINGKTFSNVTPDVLEDVLRLELGVTE